MRPWALLSGMSANEKEIKKDARFLHGKDLGQFSFFTCRTLLLRVQHGPNGMQYRADYFGSSIPGKESIKNIDNKSV